jgi:uncharacterized protein (TIGR00251 family)
VSFLASKKGIILNLSITPNAPKTQLCGKYGDRLKIKLKAPPVDGKANKELIKYLNGLLKKHKIKCELIGGKTSKNKRVLLKDFFDIKLLEDVFKSADN